jgi:aspartate kinase
LPVLQTFASLVSRCRQPLTVVVSAIPEIRQVLEEGIELLTGSSATSGLIINRVNEHIRAIFRVFGQAVTGETLETECNNLFNLLKGIELTGDFSLALKDQVLSYSERITAGILQAFLKNNSVASDLVFPEEIGLKATDEFGNASLLFTDPEPFIASKFARITLVPGAYGVTSGGKIARLGKRSADYSAAGIARLLQADCLELWELDQEFRTADPQIIPEAQLIPRLTYDEASELSYFSELSIHPRIVEPLVSLHIPIHIFQLKDREKQLSTIINSESFVAPGVVKSVVHTSNIAVLKLNGPGVGFKPGILAKVTGAFHLSGINIRSVITSQVSINMILNKREIAKAREICEQLKLSSVSEIVIDDQVSLIAVVGHGMQQHHGVSARLFTAVANLKINVLLSGSGASDLVSYLIVKQKDTRKAITEIHNIFFSKNI